jgi:4-amino-4-deoxy-L-arabinose transferase-like glycosyltransferase
MMKTDNLAPLALATLFALLLLASWQRWTQPLLDHGREMNLPARLLAGEQLYTDAQFLYGPLAPHFNALLYRLFGVHLAVLHSSGAVCAMLILLLVYWLARQLLSAWEAAATTALVMVVCALKSTANYIQPYAYAALYGLVFALGSLAASVRFAQRGRARWLAWAGVLAGLSLLAKPELALAALLAAGAAWLLDGKQRWRNATAFVLPALALPAAVYAVILQSVPLRVLLDDNHILFTAMPPQLVYFNRHISGLAQWPASLWFSLAGLGGLAVWAGASGLLGAWLARGETSWPNKKALALLLGGALWHGIAVWLLGVPGDVTPFAAAVFVLPVLIVWLLRRGLAPAEKLLLVLAVFSLGSILRAFLNVTTTGPYTPFFIPVLLVVYLCLLFRLAPAWLFEAEAARAQMRRALVALLALLVVGMALNSARRWRRLNTYAINAPRGSFITTAEIGQPLAAAIRYAREHTAPDDYVLALPVATTINFLAERRYPWREEIVHPGFLTGEKERAAIELLQTRRVRLILLANLDTSEFRDRTFGLDYNQRLLQWIEEHYRLAARFDTEAGKGARWGERPFFILAYERR